MGRRGHIGRGALNCIETLLMHSKCVRKFPRKELSLVSCIEKFAKYSSPNCLREYPCKTVAQFLPKCFAY